MLDPIHVSFRSIATADLPVLYTWRHSAHVRQWWDPPASLKALLVEHQRKIELECEGRLLARLILYDRQPIGYILAFRHSSWPEYQAGVGLEDEAIGLEIFIGEASYLHQGLGSPILKGFLHELVFPAFPDVTTYTIGPEPENTIAIRAYERVGFTYLKSIDLPAIDERQYVMHMARSHGS